MDVKDLIQQLDLAIARFKEDKLEKEMLLALRDKAKEFLTDLPEAGRDLGKYFSQIDQVIKSRVPVEGLNMVRVLNGKISIGHKPGGKVSYEGLKSQGISTVLTLLNKNEDAHSIQKGVEKTGLVWFWFPFSASNPPKDTELDSVRKMYSLLQGKLERGESIYIHCSAGIHRTGMVTYGFLRFLGFDPEAARYLLKRLRTVTFEQVGEERLAWGDQLARIELD